MARLYPNLINVVAQAVAHIFGQNTAAPAIVEQALRKDSRFGARDRKFIATYIYNIVRWYRLYMYCLNAQQQQSAMLYHYLFAVSYVAQGNDLPDMPEFKDLNQAYINECLEKAKQTFAVSESIPDWLDIMGAAQLGKEIWQKEIHALNEEAGVYIRVNTLKTNPSKLYSTLAKEGVNISPISSNHLFDNFPENCFLLNERKNLQHLDSYKNGLFEIQDVSSQLVAPYLQLKPGMFLIDACAGAGGKTLHAGSMMNNSGKITAMDISPTKLEELNRRAKRAGLNIVETVLISEQEILKNKEKADRLLLDVPCSGLGVLRRNPDAKWKLDTAFISHIQTIQSDILTNYSTMLKPGGLMVYATCSILPSENEMQIKSFLANNHQFELIKHQSIMPSWGYDGFYMACLRKAT
ncbi:MAG: methyltransferase domain-containing protein [Bacteroidia bacterium]|nr:methyltransferase domain-containing protein [Bacteroidia bacterium]